MKNQKNRSMKVHAQSGYNYKATPTIILKGQWLQEMGFEIGDYISVSCENGKLIITPDAEKAAIYNRCAGVSLIPKPKRIYSKKR